jgi:hypothetical protein
MSNALGMGGVGMVDPSVAAQVNQGHAMGGAVTPMDPSKLQQWGPQFMGSQVNPPGTMETQQAAGVFNPNGAMPGAMSANAGAGKAGAVDPNASGLPQWGKIGHLLK